MARSNATLIVTEGVAGSGKSFSRCAYAIPEFLREVKPGQDSEGNEIVAWHISNFPVRLDDWEDSNGKTHKGMASLCESDYDVPAEEVFARVQIIPEEVLKTWQDKTSGPWDYFREWNLSGCHIAIDEAHNFIPQVGMGQGSAQHKQKWQVWLGEVRHRGCTVELLSQDSSKIAKEVLVETGLRISIVNAENTRIPRLGILLGDVLELWAKFVTGRYTTWCLEHESIRMHGKWLKQHGRARLMVPKYFDVYNSHSKPQAGGREGRSVERAFKRYSRFGLLWWFFLRNAGVCLSVLAICAFLVFVGPLGGHRLIWKGVSSAAASAHQFVKSRREARLAAEGKSPVVKQVGNSEVRDRFAELPKGVQADATPELRKELEAAYAAFDKVKGELEVVKGSEAKLKGELELLEAKIRRAFEVASIGVNEVTFREGYTYGVGEVIDWGPFEGRTVKSVDWRRRSVALDDGQILRMGHVQPRTDLVRRSDVDRVPGAQPAGTGAEVVAPQPVTPDQPDVSRPLRPARGDQADGGPSAARRGTPADRGATNAAYPVRSVVEQRGGDFDRGRTTIRR